MTPAIAWIDPADRALVADLGRRMYPDVVAWTSRFPSALSDRIPNVCLTWAATCPDASLPLLVTLSRWAMATFAVDEVMDGSRYDHAQREELLTLCARAVEDKGRSEHSELPRSLPGGVAEPWREVLDAVTVVCREVRALPAADRYYPLFAQDMTRMLRGMSRELAWQQALVTRGAYPSYEEYLHCGALTIGAPAGVALLLCGSSGRWPGASVETGELAALREEIALACGASIRLANDLRTYAREMREQKPNSVSILVHVHRLAQDAARARIEEVQKQHGQRLAQLAAELPEALERWGAWVVRLERVSTSLYRNHDFHDASEALRRWFTGALPGAASTHA
ncbi:terpene synthase family protein [Chondromyces apiculatus]|uniref:Terpene synthase n=1 Tax=Chondromyces apiculatus DSM 436 TaxID=1192034 RepID=A0A017TIH1_9BACT|nr:terpene synthase family protein [Chondromyces apiculatus]EYF08697.1 Hypothetical protein CAP_2558 [Chondromyces apiculatus DSM 436]